jgi:hypothetical protein
MTQLSAESNSCFNVLSQLYSDNTRDIRKPQAAMESGRAQEMYDGRAKSARAKPNLYLCRRSRRMPKFLVNARQHIRWTPIHLSALSG